MEDAHIAVPDINRLLCDQSLSLPSNGTTQSIGLEINHSNQDARVNECDGYSDSTTASATTYESDSSSSGLQGTDQPMALFGVFDGHGGKETGSFMVLQQVLI